LYSNVPSYLSTIVLQCSFIPGYYCTPMFLHTWVLLYSNVPSYLGTIVYQCFALVVVQSNDILDLGTFTPTSLLG
jgi:hypothetical protein